MSRNLCRTGCYFCMGKVELLEVPRLAVPADCKAYFKEYAKLIVAAAACVDCGAQYLAWVNGTINYGTYPLRTREYPGMPLFVDLSFRSTFNDEPGDADLPTKDPRLAVATRLELQAYRLREKVRQDPDARVGWARVTLEDLV